MANIEKMNTKYVDLNGLEFFAKELRLWLSSHIIESETYQQLNDSVKSAINRITALENSDLYQIVSELPEVGNENVIYLYRNTTEGNENIFIEYLYTDNGWEEIGNFTPKLELDDYLKIEDSPFEKGSADNSAVLKDSNNQAILKGSVATGYATIAGGRNSHTEGESTIAEGHNSHAEGQYNKPNSDAIHSVGIGTSEINRKNAHEIMRDGKHYIIGIGGYDGTNPTEAKDVATVINELVDIISQITIKVE